MMLKAVGLKAGPELDALIHSLVMGSPPGPVRGYSTSEEAALRVFDELLKLPKVSRGSLAIVADNSPPWKVGRKFYLTLSESGWCDDLETVGEADGICVAVCRGALKLAGAAE